MRALERSVAIVGLCLLLAVPAAAQSLRGSMSSVTRQYRAARDHDFTFLRDAGQIKRFADAGYLVEIPGNDYYVVANVSYAYARPEVKLFLERLGAQYMAACNERLVITSLTRATTDQPNNASGRSVHPTGMAVDIRRSNQRTCRNWIEDVLLSLERDGVVEATRERYPPHYHVAVFPRQYARHVASLSDQSLPDPEVVVHYTVRNGDSLWTIARDYGIKVDALKAANNLRGNQIFAGQTLRIPPVN